MRIQPTHTRTGPKPSRNVPGESRSCRPFVQPPSAWASATTRPAPATMPISSQNLTVVCWPTSVAVQSSRPARPAASAVVRPRVRSYSPYLRIRSPLLFEASAVKTEQRRRRVRLFETQSASVEARRPELCPELLDRRAQIVGKDVFHDPHFAVVVERQVDVLGRDDVHRRPQTSRAPHGEPDRAVSRSEQEKGGWKDGTRPLLRVAEEAPWPLPRSDSRRGELTELGRDRLDPRGHQVQ